MSSIWQDQENENVGRHTRNASKRTERAMQQATKRTAFGEVTNVTNTRKQPARAAKDRQQTAFTVFEDKENSSDAHASKAHAKKKSDVEQRSVLAALPNVKSEPDTIVIESPMALDDVSCMETSLAPAEVTEELTEDAYLCMPEYSENIHDYLRQAELKFRPKLTYMRKQTDISTQMRMILVDWLVEVGEEYKLHDETLFLAVSYIDRFLSQMSVLRGKLQLVGTACMYIASKFEEIYPPDVGEFVYITDDTYTKNQVLRMEHLVIKVLSFNLSVPTPNVFIDFYCQLLQANEQIRMMAKYILELSLLDCDTFLGYIPSMLASSSLFLSAYILGGLEMNAVEKVTKYCQAEVAVCVQNLLIALKEAESHPQQAIREKYSHDSRRAVSAIPVPDLL